jgi:hypothetical protein
MLARVFSAAIQGVDAIQVEIEVNAGSGDPAIVWLACRTPPFGRARIGDHSYRQQRVSLASVRTTVNLAPAI